MKILKPDNEHKDFHMRAVKRDLEQDGGQLAEPWLVARRVYARGAAWQAVETHSTAEEAQRAADTLQAHDRRVSRHPSVVKYGVFFSSTVEIIDDQETQN
jgi:hypothetical protein